MSEETNVQNLEDQGTTLDVQEENQDESEMNTETSAPQEEQNNPETDAREAEESAEESVSEPTGEASEPYLTVNYNHQAKDLTREEAITLAQKGLKYDSFHELHKKLDYAAALSGTDVNTLVEQIIKAPEEAHRKHLEELYGDDSESIDIGMEIFRKKQGDTYDQILADRASAEQAAAQKEEQSVQSRLAEEYIELKREIPDAPEYASLPDAVIVEAASGRRDLMSAFLRYMHREKQNISAAQATQQAAAKASAGTMKTDEGDNLSAFDKGFLAGLRG